MARRVTTRNLTRRRSVAAVMADGVGLAFPKVARAGARISLTFRHGVRRAGLPDA